VKKTIVAFLAFLGLLIAGLGTCLPGICGCAVSWLPDKWEVRYWKQAFAADAIGLGGCVVSGVLLLVLWTRRETIKSGRAAIASRGTEDD
jgi:hypothetical protein